MRVKGVRWVGTRTERFDDMVQFAETVLGLAADQPEAGVALFNLDDGSLFEVFSPEHPGGGHPATGVVAGFQVDDVAAAHAELASAGIEVTKPRQSGSDRWAYFRAPDGNWYEIVDHSADRAAD